MNNVTSASANANASFESGKSYPRRADFRYQFSGTIEVQNAKSGTRIVATASNLSRYGCYIQTETSFPPGTSVKLKMTDQGTDLRCDGNVIWTLDEGMGIHFGKLQIPERVMLKEWLMQLTGEELKRRLGESAEAHSDPTHKIVLVAAAVILVSLVAGTLVWSGVLR